MCKKTLYFKCLKCKNLKHPDPCLGRDSKSSPIWLQFQMMLKDDIDAH